jgi:hypothetical protein
VHAGHALGVQGPLDGVGDGRDGGPLAESRGTADAGQVDVEHVEALGQEPADGGEVAAGATHAVQQEERLAGAGAGEREQCGHLIGLPAGSGGQTVSLATPRCHWAPSGTPGGGSAGDGRQDGAMGQVVATAERVVRAPEDRVRAALADYAGTRRRVLPEQFSDYRVESGGQGAGTRVAWRFAATSKRVRDQLVEVSDGPDGALVETDTRSSMVTTWTVHPADAGLTTVRVRTTWNGAGGVGGFFERTFAPKGLRRVYEDLLGRLERELPAA